MLIRTLATILAVTLGGSMAFAVPQLPCSSVPEYRALLVHLGQASEAPAVDADELIAQVPVECKVEVVGKQFQFSTIHIHAQVFAIKTAEGEDRAAKIQALREGLARQVKALDGYTNHIDPTAQPKLNQIFTRGEFNRVGKQNADAIIREKLFGLLVALFTFIAKNPAQAALFAEAFAWSIAGVVAAAYHLEALSLGYRRTSCAGPPEDCAVFSIIKDLAAVDEGSQGGIGKRGVSRGGTFKLLGSDFKPRIIGCVDA